MIFVILLLGVIILTGYWKLTDPRPFREQLHEHTNLHRVAYGLAQVDFLILGYYATKGWQWSVPSLDRLIELVGLGLFFVGCAIGIWAKHTMRKNWGPPAQHMAERQSELVTTGPFAFSRNPIYLGLILISLGFSLALRSYIIVLIPLIYWYFDRAVKKEEILLEQYFGKPYLAYKGKTARFLWRI